MKHFLSLAIAISLSLTSFSQEMTREFVVKNGDVVEHVLPLEFKYLLPEFTDMTIMDDSGNEYSGKLNVFLPGHTLRMINDRGDTLLVADQEHISRVTSPDVTKIHAGKKYATMIAGYGETTLSELCTVELEYEQIIESTPRSGTASGNLDLQYSKTGSVQIIKAPQLQKRHNPVPADSEIILKCTYRIEYVLTHGDKIYPAGLKSFQKVFPASKSAIKDYVRTYHTYFNERESVLNLFNYCVKLQEIM